jgi:hypothetical protein
LRSPNAVNTSVRRQRPSHDASRAQ